MSAKSQKYMSYQQLIRNIKLRTQKLTQDTNIRSVVLNVKITEHYFYTKALLLSVNMVNNGT